MDHLKLKELSNASLAVGGMKGGLAVKVHEASLSRDLQGSILKPAEQTGWCVVVLAGSSGRVDGAHAPLFAGLGAVCIAEAALLSATDDPRVRVVVAAISPSSVVWANTGRESSSGN